MKSLYAGIINESQKLFSRKRTFVLLGISAVIPLLGILFVLYLQNSHGIRMIESTRFPLMILGWLTDFLLPLFICMNVSESFAGELGDRNLKTCLLRPITRFKVFMAKIASAGVFIVVCLGLVFMESAVCGFFIDARENMLGGLLDSIIAYGVSIVPMLLIAILVAFVAQLFKSSGGTITICILIFIALGVLKVVFPGTAGLIPTSYTGWNSLWIGSYIPVWKIINTFMFMLSYSIIFLASGFFLFDRKEL